MDDRRKKFRELVKQRAIENFDRGSFLQKNRTYSHYCMLDDCDFRKRVHVLSEQFLLEKRQRRRGEVKIQQDFEILLANLFTSNIQSLAISLNRNDYSPSRYRRASYTTIELVHWLEENEYIRLAKGYYRTEKESRMTRIQPTRKLIDFFTPLHPLVDYKPAELVCLKDKDKNLINYVDSSFTNKLRKSLQNINKVNRTVPIEFKTRYGCQKLSTDLYAVFNNSSWKEGGRFYTSRFGHQALHKEDRKHIYIDGQKTAELDYSGLHIRLLYAMDGIPYSLDKDPYKDIESYCQELRPFLKDLLLALLNADSLNKAEKAINYNYRNDYDLLNTLRAIGTRTSELIDQFTLAHPFISRHFCQSMGMKLMNLDSKIALSVIEHFAKKEIQILPVHDSFIVQEQHEDELRKVMKEAFKSHANGFECPIKKA